MLRDVFYYGKKPNVHPREKPAKNLEDARRQTTTEHFWIVNEFCDYTNFDWDFDFDFLPDDCAWQSEHNNIWPSIHQRDSGTWLCSREYSGYIVYRTDVEPLKRYVDMSNYVLLEKVDTNKFDFSWHPDPTEPPFIYKWGCKYYPAEIKHVLEYRVLGATQEKYMSEPVELEPNWEFITEIQKVDRTKFDMSWRPSPLEPPFIYVWGNKHIEGKIKSTLEYHVPGAMQVKFMEEKIPVVPDWDLWKEKVPVDKNKFDFTWRPDPREPAYIYVFGNKWHSPEKEHTLEYHMPGATDYKYIKDIIVPIKEDKSKFKILIPIDQQKFDFSWRPDPGDPPYIYVFGNQWNDATTEPTVEYHVLGATERKYITDVIAYVIGDKSKFELLYPIVESEFDFSWRPNPYSPPYIYAFGNKQYPAEIMPTLLYKVEGATEIKYVSDIVGKLAPNKDNWKELIPIDESFFDYSWVPNPKDPPYIYVFGNQWNDATTEPTIEYHVTGAIDKKYITDITAKTLPSTNNYKTLIPVEYFDYSWRPNPHSPPYIYVFGNDWNDAATEPTIEYYVEGAKEYKYVDYPVAITKPILENWSVSNEQDYLTFNFSWRPNPHSPPQIYQWEDNGPTYTVPGATEVVFMRYDDKHRKKTLEDMRKNVNIYTITSTLENLIKEHPNEVFWAINPNLNYTDFDFGWRPDEETFRHINVFGNEYSIDTQTYYVNAPLYMLGYRDFNYIQSDKIKIDSKLSMIFIDKGNPESKERYETLRQRYPQMIKTRYLNSWVDTITRCINKAETEIFWIVNSELDYTDFKFDFYPSPWQMKMLHIFGTQWNHWGTTFLINKDTFLKESQYVKIMEHLGSLNFVKNKIAKATTCLYDIYLIDHGNTETPQIAENLKFKAADKTVHVVPFDKNYLTTFKNIVEKLNPTKETFIWVSNSICDYEKFDFSFICDPYAKENLHVFSTDHQKLGDTFLINVNQLKSMVKDLETLDQYEKINYVNFPKTKRLPAPVFISDDTHQESILQQDYDFPYAIFKTKDNEHLNINYNKPLCLWEENRNIEILSTGGSSIIVPKEVKKKINKELYDYPNINKAEILLKSQPLDIVFLSNGETLADDHFNYLQIVTKGLQNRVVRVDGINGRAAAYHAAARASNTPWFFAVFAKLKVDKDFDFNWQPDRLQVSKHYIFNALNPVNKLVYGHQAMIAYNKKLVLNNSGRGLDFTLDDPHDVVDILSGIAKFNTDAFSTWRTAFREVIKLKSDYKDISYERLQTWLNVAEGDFAEDCLRGAKDGVEYYNEVHGDIEQLKLSYEWDWLRKKYMEKYQ